MEELASVAESEGGGAGGQACSPPGTSVSSLRGGTVSSLSVYILAAFRCRYRASISFRVRGTRQLKTQQRVITTGKQSRLGKGQSSDTPGLVPKFQACLHLPMSAPPKRPSQEAPHFDKTPVGSGIFKISFLSRAGFT